MLLCRLLKEEEVGFHLPHQPLPLSLSPSCSRFPFFFVQTNRFSRSLVLLQHATMLPNQSGCTHAFRGPDCEHTWEVEKLNKIKLTIKPCGSEWMTSEWFSPITANPGKGPTVPSGGEQVNSLPQHWLTASETEGEVLGQSDVSRWDRGWLWRWWQLADCSSSLILVQVGTVCEWR